MFKKIVETVKTTANQVANQAERAITKVDEVVEINRDLEEIKRNKEVFDNNITSVRIIKKGMNTEYPRLYGFIGRSGLVVYRKHDSANIFVKYLYGSYGKSDYSIIGNVISNNVTMTDARNMASIINEINSFINSDKSNYFKFPDIAEKQDEKDSILNRLKKEVVEENAN